MTTSLFKKTYFLKKISHEHLPKFLCALNKDLNDQNNFLNPLQQQSIIIGKKLNLSKTNKSYSMISYIPRIHNPQQANIQSRSKDKEILETSTAESQTTPLKVMKPKSVFHKYKYVNDEDLKTIFSKYKKNSHILSSRNCDDTYINSLPKIDISSKLKLTLQKKALNNKKSNDDNMKILEEYLSSRTHKDKNDLLVSPALNYQYRQGSLCNLKRNSKMNSCLWEKTLRIKSKLSTNKSNCFISCDLNSKMSTDLSDMISSPMNNNKSVMSNRIDSHSNKFSKSLSSLSVLGENLLKIEENAIKEFKGRKKLIEFEHNDNLNNNEKGKENALIYEKGIIAERWNCK